MRAGGAEIMSVGEVLDRVRMTAVGAARARSSSQCVLCGFLLRLKAYTSTALVLCSHRGTFS